MTAARPRRAAAPDKQDKKPRDVTINLRATAPMRALIDRAAAALGKSRTEFVLDSACRRAEDVLLDQRLFLVDEKRYRAFVALLDEPPAPSERLRRLMAGKPPWRD